MSKWVFAASLAALMCSTAAHAVSITNRDDKDYKVTVIEGDASGPCPRKRRGLSKRSA